MLLVRRCTATWVPNYGRHVEAGDSVSLVYFSRETNKKMLGFEDDECENGEPLYQLCMPQPVHGMPQPEEHKVHTEAVQTAAPLFFSVPSQPVTFVPEESAYVFSCPHCLGTVVVLSHEVNCTIFRHAVLKATGTQVNPHAPKEELDQLLAQGLVYGCALPFKLVLNGVAAGGMRAECCGYI